MSWGTCNNCGSDLDPSGLCLGLCFGEHTAEDLCVLCGQAPSSRQSEDGVDLCDKCGYVDDRNRVWAHEDLLLKYNTL